MSYAQASAEHQAADGLLELFGEESRLYAVRDGNEAALGLYLRHYSARPNGATRYGEKNWTRFAGPTGDALILLAFTSDVLFVWRREKFRRDGQAGINCAVFRNESRWLSSGLILEAERLAWRKYPGERFYTFVDPSKIKSPNPGYCFKMAGWQSAGQSRKGLQILEKYPDDLHIR